MPWKQCLFAPCSGRDGKGRWRSCKITGIKTIIARSKENEDSIHIELETLLESEGEGTAVDCRRS